MEEKTKQYIQDIQTYNKILQNKNYKMQKIIKNLKKEIQIYSKQEDTIKNIIILFIKKYHKNEKSYQIYKNEKNYQIYKNEKNLLKS